MAALMILIVSMVAMACADTAVDPHFTPRPAYVHANKSPANSVASGNAQSGDATILAIPLSVVATSDDDTRSAVGAMHKVVAKVVEKVIDVVTDVREKVADAVDNMRDKVSDFVDDSKAGSSSRDHDDVVYKNKDNSNETKTDDSEETDTLDDNSEELKGGDSAEKSKSSIDDNSKDNDKKIKDDVNDSKNKEKSSTEFGGKQKDDSKEEISGKDKANRSEDSEEHQGDDKKDDDNTSNDKNKDDGSSEKGDGKSVWSFLKDLTGDIENESADDDTKVRHYLTRISKFRGYMDAMDSNFAASLAKQSGTCPVYPIQVGNNRVTITTENGCKIIIKLKGLSVDKIEDGHEEKKRAHKRSILVSYSDN